MSLQRGVARSSVAQDAMSTAIVLFRSNDLRLADHEPLHAAHAGFARVLHVYCFDPRWWGTSRVSGLPRMSALRCKFLLEGVDSLRASLRARGAELVLRSGATEAVVPALARAVGASAVLAHTDVHVEEAAADAALRGA